MEGFELALLGLLGTAALAVCAVVGMVVLIANRTHRSVLGYAAVVCAVMVCGLIFVPIPSLRNVPSATEPPSAEMPPTIPKAPQK
jgi:hypothetical protein